MGQAVFDSRAVVQPAVVLNDMSCMPYPSAQPHRRIDSCIAYAVVCCVVSFGDAYGDRLTCQDARCDGEGGQVVGESRRSTASLLQTRMDPDRANTSQGSRFGKTNLPEMLEQQQTVEQYQQHQKQQQQQLVPFRPPLLSLNVTRHQDFSAALRPSWLHGIDFFALLAIYGNETAGDQEVAVVTPNLQQAVLLCVPFSLGMAAMLVVSTWYWQTLAGGGDDEACSRSFTRIGSVLSSAWAFLLGVSSAISIEAQVVLNSRSNRPDLHCLWVSFFIHAAPIPLLLVSCFINKPMGCPSLAGSLSGAFKALWFTLSVAAAAFGFGVTLCVYTIGQVVAGLVSDSVVGKTSLDCTRPLGVVQAVMGAVLLFRARPRGIPAPQFSFSLQSLFLVAFLGIGSVYHERCNLQSREALGNRLRATLICNVVMCLIWAPLLMIAWTPLQIVAEDWWRWAFCLLQQLNFTVSMAALQEHASAVATQFAIVCGMLATGVAIDIINETSSPSLAFIGLRVAGGLLAVIGAGLSLRPTDSQSGSTSDSNGQLDDSRTSLVERRRPSTKSEGSQLSDETEIPGAAARWWVCSRRRLRGFLLLNAATLLWGTNQVLIQYVEEAGVSEGLLLFVRFFIAALALAPWAVKGFRDLSLCTAALELGVCVFVGFVSQAIGLQYTSAAKTSIILSFQTVLVPLLAWFDNKHIAMKIWASGVSAVIGVIMLSIGGENGLSSLSSVSAMDALFGDGLQVLATSIFAVIIWRSEKYARRYPRQTVELVAVQMFVVCVLAFAYVLGSEASDVTSSWRVTTLAARICLLPRGVLAAMAFMGFGTTSFGLWAETEGLKAVDATTAAVIYTLEPLWGALFAWIFMAQALHGLVAWLGAGLLVASSILGQWPDSEWEQDDPDAGEPNSPARVS